MRMRRALLCSLLLALLIPTLLLARDRLPPNPQPLIEAKYGGWSGVLRLWIFEGWEAGSGSAVRWLNRCIAAFERQHPGVYVQPEPVDAAAIADLGENGLLPPDLLLFPPALLSAPDLLEPLSLDLPLRAPLADCGRAGDALVAALVLAGGYLWAYNAAQLDGIPGSWRDAGAEVSALPDEPWHQWSAALLALCSARWSERADAVSPEPDPGEMDLGLAAGNATAAPTPAPTPAGTLDCALPADFALRADAFRAFQNGELAAMPVTQREVRRLEALSEQGRGVDWRLAATGDGAFTDQLLFLGIVRSQAADVAERRALCEALLLHLLSDDCQGTLASVGAFSVTEAASGYPAGDALLPMEQALRAPGLSAPRCVDGSWKLEAEEIVRVFLDGEAVPAELWQRLSMRLRENPNNHLPDGG